MKLRAALLAVSLLTCGGAVVPAPSPTIQPTPTAQPTAHAFNPRSFSFGLYYLDSERESAIAIAAELPAAWAKATGGRGEIHRTFATPDVHVFVGDEPPATLTEGIEQAYFVVAPGLRFVYLHRGTPRPTLELVHEFAHILGAPHWYDCPNPPVEIMCNYQGSATTFSERELRAMGLE